jgi:hypothetical protein
MAVEAGLEGKKRRNVLMKMFVVKHGIELAPGDLP